MQVELSDLARKDMEALPKKIALRIGNKVRWFANQADPLVFAMPLIGSQEKLYRFRIGDYRAIFALKGNGIRILFVMAVKHRREAYR